MLYTVLTHCMDIVYLDSFTETFFEMEIGYIVLFRCLIIKNA